MCRSHLMLLFIPLPAWARCEWKAYITTLSRGISDEWWPLGVAKSWLEGGGAIFFPSWDQRDLNSTQNETTRGFEIRQLTKFDGSYCFCHSHDPHDHEILGLIPTSIPGPGVDALACVAGATITPTYLESFSVPWPKEVAGPQLGDPWDPWDPWDWDFPKP